EDTDSRIKTYGIHEWETFSENGRSYLLPANGFNPGANRYHIQLWDGEKLSNVGNSLPVIHGMTSWKHLEIGDYNYFLAGKPNTKTDMVYNWCYGDAMAAGEALCPVDATITTPGIDNPSTHTWDHLHVDGQDFVFRVNSTPSSHIAVQVYIANAIK
ncbi:MAG: hypothetical protein ACHP9Y_05235, partial [Gammaproteobacteria bacterium]